MVSPIWFQFDSDVVYGGVQEAKAKHKFIKKLLEALSGALGEPVDAVPKHVLAGLEPEKTNRMLQSLAKAGGCDGALYLLIYLFVTVTPSFVEVQRSAH